MESFGRTFLACSKGHECQPRPFEQKNPDQNRFSQKLVMRIIKKNTRKLEKNFTPIEASRTRRLRRLARSA